MIPDSLRKRLNAEILLFVAMFIWGANYPLAKYGLAGMDPLLFNAIRYIVAVSVIWMISRSGGQRMVVEPSDRWRLLRAGLVASVFYQIFFIVGLSMTTSGNAALILATSPLWTVLLHARMHRETIPRPILSGILLSSLGVVFIIAGSGKEFGFGGREFLGGCILLLSAFMWGLNTNLQKPLLKQYSPTHLSLVLMGIGAVGLTAVAIPGFVRAGAPIPAGEYLLAAVLSGAFSIGISNVLWSHGVKVLGPSKTSSFNNLVPVIALVLSYFTLHERPAPLEYAGAALTIAGIWIARR